MWFEADPVLPYLTTIDPLLSDPGLNPGQSPDTWSTFSGPRANPARVDYLADPTWAGDDSQFGLDLFSYATVIADKQDETFASKDGYRAMNEDGVIVVTGTRYSRLDTYSWWGSGPGVDYWTVQLDGGGGLGERDTSSNTDFSVDEDDAECENGAAINAGAEISGLVLSVGNFEFTGVLAANADGSFGLLNNELSTTYSSTSSTFDRADFSSALGMVHNHPFNDSDYLSNFQQRYPSDDDWLSLEGLIAGGADPSRLSVFILDPFGDMREFSYADRALYQAMSDTQRGQDENLPPETEGCAGGGGGG